MKTTSYSDLRKNLAAMLDSVESDHEPVVITRDKGKPAASSFLRHRGRQEIIGLVTWRFRADKAARSNEVRQHVKLITQLGVKLTAALVGRERTVTVGRHIQRIPADQHSPGLLALI